MKVLGISCSLRKHGNTEILVGEVLASAKEAGAEVELVTLIGKEIKPCDGCYACRKTGECHIKDDMEPIYGKMLEADGIILGTPVYFYNMAGQTKVFIDRTYPLRYPHFRLANKVGGTVVVAGRNGLGNTTMSMQMLFILNHMVLADHVSGLASDRGAVRKDMYAMKEAAEVGKQMVSLISKGFKFAEGYDSASHHYIREKYGVTASPFG